MEHTDERRARLIADELERVDGVRPGRDTPGRKHRKMASNPFHFYRGSAQIFYTDLKEGVLLLPAGITEWVKPTAVVGDCELLCALLDGRLAAAEQASIVGAYRAAFARGGSARERASVLDQVDFLIDLGVLRSGLKKVREALGA